MFDLSDNPAALIDQIRPTNEKLKCLMPQTNDKLKGLTDQTKDKFKMSDRSDH